MVYSPFLAGQRATAQGVNTNIVTELMAWTPLASLGAWGSGFAANAGAPPQLRRLSVAGVELWELKGRVDVTGLTAATTKTAFTFTTLSTGSERGFEVYGANTSFYGVRLAITGKVMAVGVPTAAGGSCSGIVLDAVRIADPAA